MLIVEYKITEIFISPHTTRSLYGPEDMKYNHYNTLSYTVSFTRVHRLLVYQNVNNPRYWLTIRSRSNQSISFGKK